MQLAPMIDRLVGKIADLPNWQRIVIRTLFYPFIFWRMRQIAHVLATQYEWLPDISWSDIEKHGQNVVFCTYEVVTGFIKEKSAAFVVDYKNQTVRRVLRVPEKHQNVGAMF
jgi:hypothetical protein